jgi:hypothetical protein
MNAMLLQSCPGCIEASSPTLFEGFLWGLAIMMSMPFVLLLVVGGGLFYARRQELRQAVERLLTEDRDGSSAGRPGAAQKRGT